MNKLGFETKFYRISRIKQDLHVNPENHVNPVKTD